MDILIINLRLCITQVRLELPMVHKPTAVRRVGKDKTATNWHALMILGTTMEPYHTMIP